MQLRFTHSLEVIGLLWLVLPLLCALSGCGGPERKVYRGGTVHLPLLDGRVMKYEEREGNNVRDFTVSFRYMGGRKIKTYEAVYKGIDLGEVRFNSDGTRVTFVTSEPRIRVEDLPEYREVWLDESAEPGDAWDDYDTGTQTVFAGFESVRVPLGSYPDCYKAVTTGHPSFPDSLKLWLETGRISRRDYEEQLSAAHVTVVRWFAPDVGLVKEQFSGSGLTRELVAVISPGSGLPDTSSETTPQTDQE